MFLQLADDTSYAFMLPVDRLFLLLEDLPLLAEGVLATRVHLFPEGFAAGGTVRIQA